MFEHRRHILGGHRSRDYVMFVQWRKGATVLCLAFVRFWAAAVTTETAEMGRISARQLWAVSGRPLRILHRRKLPLM
ncbi:hypothetical protein GCM10010869_28810 [Mesorhizobium tianshanense]|uniref:Uncharacterized protein n=1 Tax=Mesorhizobium tianshanense TaxID=39844 RepID=A0A562M8I9_9HYPH|nr:hypothetical protein IQ26_07733 [Mesorhizobium tianshanense]GLS37288.1 hypothetical protein GCM10010869_28810 [Mesorhizobium tianshanense]